MVYRWRDDSSLLEINPQTGKISFKNLPDYENPLDKNKDNSYEVVIKAIDKDNKISKQNFSTKVKDDGFGIKLYKYQNSSYKYDDLACLYEGDKFYFKVSVEENKYISTSGYYYLEIKGNGFNLNDFSINSQAYSPNRFIDNNTLKVDLRAMKKENNHYNSQLPAYNSYKADIKVLEDFKNEGQEDLLITLKHTSNNSSIYSENISIKDNSWSI